MRIKDYIKNTQPEVNYKLNMFKSKNEELTYLDFENLMKHSAYRRGKGGGLRQIK